MDYQVIFSFPSGQLGGVDVFTMHLMRGLLERDVPAHILLTETGHDRDNGFPFPEDLSTTKLLVPHAAHWRTRWKRMIEYLEAHAPCIYVPSYDYAYSCVSPRLSDRVKIVGIVHSDDEHTYAYLQRLGPYWNAIVAVSDAIAARAAVYTPALKPRIVTIHNGVRIPDHFTPREPDPCKSLQVVYAGRLAQHQKRVFDIAKIANLTCERGLAIQFTIVGAGPDAAELRRRCAVLVERGAVRFTGILPNTEVLEVFANADVVMLTSEFEGFPISLLEAMGHGCIPVVTEIRSGIPELVKDGVNGYSVTVGDIEMFVTRLGYLQQDVALRQGMSWNAYLTIREGGYRDRDMVERYLEVFDRVSKQPDNTYRRPYGPVMPPKELYWQERLPYPLWLAGHHGKQILSRLSAPFGRNAIDKSVDENASA